MNKLDTYIPPNIRRSIRSLIYFISIFFFFFFFFFLPQLNMKHTRYYIAAGLLMLFSFFCVRILVFPYLYLRYAYHAGLTVWQVPHQIPIKCNLGCLMIFLPQLYWFALMMKGTLKYFKTERKDEALKEK